MPFIQLIPDADIGPDVHAMYDCHQSPGRPVPDYARVFCHRPEIMELWAAMQAGIRRHMDKRRFELIAFAASHTLRSTLCSLAHGRALTVFFTTDDIEAMARGASPASLTDAEAAMMAFARKVARGAYLVTSSDVDVLKSHGFADAEVFDISAAVSARAFWIGIVDSLGVEPEPPFLQLEREFRKALTVGRPIATGHAAAVSRP